MKLLTALRGIDDRPIGVAVSGGGDSVALLYLLHEAGKNVSAVTIDHGLRDESADEAKGVAQHCAQLGIHHTILTWDAAGLTGNLQQNARNARRKLIAGWAIERGLERVALGHTKDDQAETVLMRLARGSGVDGLAGMARVRHDLGITWLRPLLACCRADLRVYLRGKDIPWVDDPTNENARFDRVKIRQALQVLAPLGIDRDRLAQTAEHMQRAKYSLDLQTLDLAHASCEVQETGDVHLDMLRFSKAPMEIQLRLLAATLRWVSSTPYRPRFKALTALLQSMDNGENPAKTLHGCVIYQPKATGAFCIGREPHGLLAPVAVHLKWDTRWNIFGPRKGSETLRALGQDGLEQAVDWRDSGLYFKAALAVPSVWRHDELIAAPLVNMQNGWETTLVNGQKGFYDSIITLKAAY